MPKCRSCKSKADVVLCTPCLDDHIYTSMEKAPEIKEMRRLTKEMDALSNKYGDITPEEWDIIQAHREGNTTKP